MKGVGVKPFLHVQVYAGNPRIMSLDAVMAQAPWTMETHIALPAELGCPPLARSAIVHLYVSSSSGQAETIDQWLDGHRMMFDYVLISNCDNLVNNHAIIEGLNFLEKNPAMHGIVFTFKPSKDNDDRYSYTKLKPDGEWEFREKDPFSEDAIAGVYILKTYQLSKVIQPSDKYLAEALNRMRRLHVMRVQTVRIWGTPEQLAEVEAGKPQSRS
jgi:hypothetical protein